MATLQNQVDYYLNCTETEQAIIRAFALKAGFNYESEIQTVLEMKFKITQKPIKDLIKAAIEIGILSSNGPGYSWSAKKYKISLPFMVYIYPELEDFKMEWDLLSDKLSKFYYLTEDNKIYLIRSFLYELLFEDKVQNPIQAILVENPRIIISLHLDEYPQYMAMMDKLNVSLLSVIYNFTINKCVNDLYSIELMADVDAYFSDNVGTIKFNAISNYRSFETFLNASFIKPVAKNDKVQSNALLAICYLASNNAEMALKYFDNELKEYRKSVKHIQMFESNMLNYFYFVTLVCIDPNVQVPRAQKILSSLDKNYYSSSDDFYVYILNNILNKKNDKSAFLQTLLLQLTTKPDLDTVIAILLAYLAELKVDDKFKHLVFDLIEKTYNADNYLFGYEAAFVANKWYATEKSAELLAMFAVKVKHQPICSLIIRHEEWERKLNLLMNALGTNKGTKNNAGETENNQRIVYIFNSNYENVQPILQTRNAKGVWSKGRNIAMKTLHAGTVQGMTDQDNRIAKTIKHISGGYYDGDTYEFTDKVFVELIGHPFVYLAGANEVLVEMVAAQPEITVTKNKNGYTLKSDIQAYSSGVMLLKETNTRFKVYNINYQQAQLIRMLTDNAVCIPEQGKDKLIQLLGEISKYATVHSDLLQSDTHSNLKIKTVKPDNRIRVQLLPFGDGLKAELFVKPFADFPPYAKPGKGGKMLIVNKNNEQWQVERNLKAETVLANTIMVDIESLESINLSDDLIAFDDPLDSLHLLDVIAKHKETCVVEWPEGERFKIKGKAEFKNLNLQIKTKNNWFELEGEIVVDEDTVLTVQQLLQLMTNKHDRFVELKPGEFLALSNELRKRLDELKSYANVGKKNVQINKFASMALGDFFDNVDNLKSDKAWKDFRKRIENASADDAKVPATLQAELRPYQEDGFKWMARLAEWEAGACLADDMGLGKTVQTLAILLQRANKGPALVVCPLSVVGNWIAEAQRFAPTLNVRMLGNNNRQQTIDELTEGDVLITSYGLLQSEEKLFVEKHFATAVLDEAHIIKNYSTKTSKVSMQLKADFRLALTGTPLQNHQGEIWNLFQFINPGLLGTMNEFNDNFIKPNNDAAGKMLKKLIKPFILRRTKTAVLDELPHKTEIIKKVQLSEQEMAFYEALRRQAILNLEASDAPGGAKNIQALAEITKLRQASCNPLLVDKNINIPSSKLSTFLEIADELIENKHRALVFSQFVSHLAIVRAALDKKGIHYKYLDGSTPMAEREKLVKSFQSGEGELFLISLKAGGLGLNLTAADFVIHLDPWWNPAIEDQASDRAHRIGQKRPVTIYRLVAENTIEEKIIKLHNSKRDLAETLLEGSDQSAKLSLNDLMTLIKENF